jgi:YafQ family addiction module toxin component
MYDYELRKTVEKIFFKLAKKNPTQLKIIEEKIIEILNEPNNYKNLRSPMQHLKRVHIDKSFVMVFSLDEKNKKVVIEDFDHHDNVYSKKKN